MSRKRTFHHDKILEAFINLKQQLSEQIDQDDLHFFFKDMKKATESFIAHLEKNHKKELLYSKDDVFPRAWMVKDRDIRKMIEDHHSFIKIVNYLFNRNRHSRGDDLRKMVEEADRFIDGRRYLDTHIYSTFLTNSEFYDDMTSKLDISKNSIQRYLTASASIGTLKLLYDGGRFGRLYADGYFKQSADNKYRKFSFLKDDPAIREGLKRLPVMIRKYAPVQI